ncbi:hypothetical protein GCK32_005786 [Trichostrongylus colubriformis]|uniref:Uncharacterized protein n=1 Tax=Trichostrongylus colubriformis TaxID=6319 RepID=A0AAN8IMZ9_TRICO
MYHKPNEKTCSSLSFIPTDGEDSFIQILFQKTQLYPLNEEDDKKKGSKEEKVNGNGEKGKEENKGKESKRSSEDYKDEKKSNVDKKNGDDKKSRDKDHKVEKKSSEEGKDKEKPHKVKTRKTEDDSWRKYRKSREAKTQCPEKSLSEEMESALRSAAEQEKKRKAEEKKQRSIEKTQYPEKSLMEEMNAALASELAASVVNSKPLDDGELKLDHTAHTDVSDKRK